MPLDDNTGNDPARRAPLVLGGADFAGVTDTVCRVVERPRPPRSWYVAFAFTSAWTVFFFVLIGYLISTGIGVWGNNIPVAWAFDITNFVFWIGIGHAGTLISAILFLFRQKWRTGVNRAAEAMTIFAVICAGIYPGIHVGRVWFAYWLAPYPNQMLVWPNFRSPLLWDVVAVSTYFTVSLLFWYLGMIPDLATLRDRAAARLRRLAYGVFALGWRGSARQWHVYERAYLLLAALATPLVLSVHSVVSTDFAVAQLPGWHTTIFPPYFVAGAIFSGLAMVVTLMVPARAYFGLKDLVTIRHLENINRMMLATGCIVGYSYGIEAFMAWYSGNQYEWFALTNRVWGPYGWGYGIMILCNVLAPQLFWLRTWRTTPWKMMIVALAVNVGMWMERFVIIVASLNRDFLPSSWMIYKPTWVDLCMLAGSFGLFLTLFLLFCRYLPIVAMSEVKQILPQGGTVPFDHEHE
jgi:molybdopterin-containing oxidoreductase family membrane subunit